MQTITIKDAADAIDAAARLIGFHPQNSLVVLPIGNGPTARVDLESPSALAESLAMARSHWGTVLVLIYTDSREKFTIFEAAVPAILPGITVVDVIHAPNDSTGRTRADLVTEAQAVVHADEAEERAVAAWRRGDGAAAWVMYDRAVALSGGASLRMQLLRVALECAVDPRAQS